MNGNGARRSEKDARHTFSIRFTVEGRSAEAVLVATLLLETVKCFPLVVTAKAAFKSTLPVPVAVIDEG